MSASVLIKAVEVEGFGGGGVVAAAFGDVQVAGVFDGRDDGGADGGQVGGPAAGAAGRGVFAERHVPDVVVRLHGPVLAGPAGPVPRGRVRGWSVWGEVLPVVGSSRGRVILRAWRARGRAGGLAGAVFRVSVRPWPVSRVKLPAGTCRQGSALTRACSSGWFFFTTAM